MSWIGKLASDPRVIVVSKQSGIESLKQLESSHEPLKFAAPGVGSASAIEAAMLVNSLGLPVRIITGYNGDEDQLAMLRAKWLAL
jgi:tripartite-type tricarboxylate transporter receptor subunit TctC